MMLKPMWTTVLACMEVVDADACNFDPEATIDDESCDFSCLTTGCSDEAAINYDQYADGSGDDACLYIGCQDDTALNYTPLPTTRECDYLEPCPGDFTGDGHGRERPPRLLPVVGQRLPLGD